MPENVLTPFPEEWREIAQQFVAMRFRYQSALREVQTKLEILNDEFQMQHRRNPIHHMESRIKKPESILQKLIRELIVRLKFADNHVF